jgi:hypothetical protein
VFLRRFSGFSGDFACFRGAFDVFSIDFEGEIEKKKIVFEPDFDCFSDFLLGKKKSISHIKNHQVSTKSKMLFAF